MDKVNSLRLYPNHLEMIGDPIGIRIKEPLAKFYKTKVSRFEHVPDDPLFDCDVYSVDNSYNNCIQDELLGLVEKEIDCQPPLLAKDQKRICNKKFNVSVEENLKIEKLLKPLFFS